MGYSIGGAGHFDSLKSMLRFDRTLSNRSRYLLYAPVNHQPSNEGMRRDQPGIACVSRVVLCVRSVVS